MERDPRMANASSTIVKLGNECVEGTVKPMAVANEIALGLLRFMGQHFSQTQVAGILRDQAAQFDRPNREGFAPDVRQLLELADKAQEFINTLQIAGVGEDNAVSAIADACILRVIRTRGAPGAALWLRRLAESTEKNGPNLELLARSS